MALLKRPSLSETTINCEPLNRVRKRRPMFSAVRGRTVRREGKRRGNRDRLTVREIERSVLCVARSVAVRRDVDETTYNLIEDVHRCWLEVQERHDERKGDERSAMRLSASGERYTDRA